MPPLPQALELKHSDFEAGYKGWQRPTAHTFTWEATQEQVLYISHFLLHILIPQGRAKCIRELFFPILLFKCIIRIVTREELEKERKSF